AQLPDLVEPKFAVVPVRPMQPSQSLYAQFPRHRRTLEKRRDQDVGGEAVCLVRLCSRCWDGAPPSSGTTVCNSWLRPNYSTATGREGAAPAAGISERTSSR